MERLRIRFLFRRGMCVRWAGHPGCWRVCWQRYTTRDVLGPLVQYGLQDVTCPDAGLQWAEEPDIHADEE